MTKNYTITTTQKIVYTKPLTKIVSAIHTTTIILTKIVLKRGILELILLLAAEIELYEEIRSILENTNNNYVHLHVHLYFAVASSDHHTVHCNSIY